jgi:ABC-type antimicrobial peptide transport system permease subunit
MRLVDLVRLVGTNLTRTRFRAALSAFGVVIGTAAIVVLFSLAAGLRQVAADNLGGLGPLNEINVMTLGGGEGGFNVVIVGASPGETRKLLPEDLEALAERPGVRAVLPLVNYRGQARAYYEQFVSQPMLKGADPEALANFDLDLRSGLPDLGRWEVVVGAKVGEAFSDPSIRSGDNRVPALALQDQTLTLKLTRTEAGDTTTSRVVRLQVVGVLAPRGFEYDYSIFLRLRDVDELNTWATGQQVNRRLSGYGQATILMEDAAAQSALETELQQAGYITMSPNQILAQINRTFYALQAVVGGIGLITLLIAGTGIANTLITAIYERTAEIGLMKAVGATTRQVTLIFLAEAAAIGGGGGLAGLLVGLLVSQVVGALAGQSVSSQLGGPGVRSLGDPGAAAAVSLVVTPLWLMVLAPLFAALVGVVAGLYPARRAATLDPVVALRHD